MQEYKINVLDIYPFFFVSITNLMHNLFIL